MSVSRTAATAARVLSQLRRDRRTVALLLIVPCVLILLVDQLFAGRELVFQSVGVPMLGLFPLISMFLVTSITMLRERTTGTLERLLTTPLTKLELLRSCRPRSSRSWASACWGSTRRTPRC